MVYDSVRLMDNRGPKPSAKAVTKSNKGTTVAKKAAKKITQPKKAASAKGTGKGANMKNMKGGMKGC